MRRWVQAEVELDYPHSLKTLANHSRAETLHQALSPLATGFIHVFGSSA